VIPVVICAKVCKDPDCRAHGPMVRRIQRLQRALAAERRYLAETERALEVNSEAVVRLRQSLARTWSITLNLMMDDTFEDEASGRTSRSLLAYVLATNPGLRERLEAALEGTRGTT